MIAAVSHRMPVSRAPDGAPLYFVPLQATEALAGSRAPGSGLPRRAGGVLERLDALYKTDPDAAIKAGAMRLFDLHEPTQRGQFANCCEVTQMYWRNRAAEMLRKAS